MPCSSNPLQTCSNSILVSVPAPKKCCHGDRPGARILNRAFPKTYFVEQQLLQLEQPLWLQDELPAVENCEKQNTADFPCPALNVSAKDTRDHNADTGNRHTLLKQYLHFYFRCHD